MTAAKKKRQQSSLDSEDEDGPQQQPKQSANADNTEQWLAAGGLGSFLFGNVDERGQLVDTDDADLMAIAQSSAVLQRILGGTPGGGMMDTPEEEAAEMKPRRHRPRPPALTSAKAAVIRPTIQPGQILKFSRLFDQQQQQQQQQQWLDQMATQPQLRRGRQRRQQQQQQQQQRDYQQTLVQLHLQRLAMGQSALVDDRLAFMGAGALGPSHRWLAPLVEACRKHFMQEQSSEGTLVDEKSKALVSTAAMGDGEVKKQDQQVPLLAPLPDDSVFHPVTLCDWEEKIIWSEEDVERVIGLYGDASGKHVQRGLDLLMQLEQLQAAKSKQQQQHQQQRALSNASNTNDSAALNAVRMRVVPNYDVEQGDWVDEIIWDDQDANRLKSRDKPVEIPLNDPMLIIDAFLESHASRLQQMHRRKRMKLLGAGSANNRRYLPDSVVGTDMHLRPPTEKYNISNDRYYDVHRAGRSGRVRKMFGGGKNVIRHSLPALKLYLPFFKRYMSKSELRLFHRPSLSVKQGDVMKFQRVKNVKKKKTKGKDITELLATVKDITLKDNSNFILFEFSEEYPLLMSNGGMGSLILNYYRKKDEKDAFLPKMTDGAPAILEPVDGSPFLSFGDVLPGQTLQALKNNLYVAPIFQHQLENDDFLLIKYTGRDQVRYYIREIPRIYTVGQAFPTAEIPPPQSRKIKNIILNRLKVVGFRFFRKHGRHVRYPVWKVINPYHRYHEQSIRKHLKEVIDMQRSVKNDQWWLALKPHHTIPTEQELWKLLTPEQVCIFEAVRVGQQRLADAGYGTGEAQEDDEEENECTLDDEVQLAPWNLSKNFLLATQNKCMVKLYGTGDPTGRGEGFSFFRSSMKEMFMRAGASMDELEAYRQSIKTTGHRFQIADQQKVYRAEINRIWNNQLAVLSSKEEPPLSEEEIMRLRRRGEEDLEEHMDEDAADIQDMMAMIMDKDKEKGGSRPVSPRGPSNSNLLARHLSQSQPAADDVETGSLASSRQLRVSKALLVRRKFINEITGAEEWHEEVILDPRITNAYLKQRRLIELSATSTNAINVDDDEDTRKRKLQEELRRLRRSVGRQQTAPAPQPTIGPDGQVCLGGSQRRCRSCGQMGHIQTNRICPNFAQNYPDRYKKEHPEQLVKSENGKLIVRATALQQLEVERKNSMKVKLPTKLVATVTGNRGDDHQPNPSM